MGKNKFKIVIIIILLLIIQSSFNSIGIAKEINDTDKITVINRWHYDLYYTYNMKLFPSIITANIIDPATDYILENIGIDNINNGMQLYKFRKWVYKNMAHTQGLDIFKDEPGKDPWGTRLDKSPTYKKLIASEMRAMYIYSDKSLTGKCGSLVNVITAMMRKLGISSENIVILRIKGHSFGLAKINGELYIINNYIIKKVDNKIFKWIETHDYYGLNNDKYAISKYFKLDKNTLIKNGALIKNIAKSQGWKLNEFLLIDQDITQYNLRDKEDLFNNKTFSSKKWLLLSKYAYQSLYVDDPVIYLKASLRGSNVKKLSERLNSIDDILRWMKENLRNKSIFKFDNERIMTADQVIVFKTGGNKDQGLLLYTLIKLNGNNPELILTTDNTFVKLNDKYIDVKNKELREKITKQKNVKKIKIDEK